MTWKIPLFDTEFGNEELEAVAAPVARGWLTMGDETAAAEADIRQRLGVARCLAVTNGTAALHMACAALGLGPGDEVLCPALTFVATANAICYTGATPVFCESIGPHDLNVDVDDARRRVSRRTRAIAVVHYAGFPARMDAVMGLAREHDLAVIEDSAHAVFSGYEGTWCGTIGDVGCFSFFSNKNVTCGEGGAVVTNRDDLAERLRLLRSHGMTSLTLDRHKGRAFTYDVLLHGYNYRIDEIRAALLRAQLRKLDDGLRRRRDLFARYVGAFEGTDVVVPFADRIGGPDWPRTAVHILAVLLPDGCDRAAVMQSMKDQAGVQTSIHYRPVHRLSAFAGANAPLPRTEALAGRELTLPFYPGLRPEDVEYVFEATLRAVAGARNVA